MQNYKYLNNINFPSDIKKLNNEELKVLSEEVRSEMIDAVSKTGGHLGAGLGVVELTVALHHVFDTPKDKLIWDVGHQSYPHKILTGRKDKIRTLRQGSGLSGFTKRSESEFDPFGAAHSSTSISAGLGIATANKLSNKSDQVIAVIGDGAMSAGMAYDAMNNAGDSKTKMIVILNDNDMSIAKPVGAMKSYLAKIFSGKIYFSFRETVKMIISSFSKRFSKKAGKAEDFLRSAVTGGTLFNSLGFYYVGPIDGHDLDVLLPILKNAKESNHNGPILIHIKTQKGKGYSFAEKSDDKYHGVTKFDVQTGVQQKSTTKTPAFTKVFANTLIEHAKKDSKIVGITAAMPSGTGMDAFSKVFPDRTFDVGIAEQHAVTFAAGLATEGYKPYTAIYSTFLQRAYDQVVHDVAIQSLPVRFAIDRAGLVGADGATHAGSFDIAFLSNLPNFITMAASDDLELARMIHTCADINHAPSAFRYPRGSGLGLKINYPVKKLVIGKGKIVQEGNDIAIISYGARLQEVKIAAKKLENYKISTTIPDARFCKPLDKKLILELCKNHKLLITIEEGSIGGFSSHVSNFLINENNALFQNTLIDCIFLPDKFIDQDTPFNMYSFANMNSQNIVTRILKKLNIKKNLTKV